MSIFNKQRIGALDVLIELVLSQIPDLTTPSGPGAPVHALAALRDRLQAARKKVIGELSGCSADGPMGVGTVVKFDPAKDGQALLNGADVATLTGAVEESQYSTLKRRLRAIDSALADLPGKIVEADLTAVTQEFLKAKPALAEVMAVVAERAESLRQALDMVNRLDQELSRRGMPICRRPSLMTGFEMNILHGGGGQPSLQWWIDHIRQVWGLSPDGKE